MVDPIAVWHTEHRRFAQLLDFLEREMVVFHAGDEPDYTLMRDVLHYLRHYGDRFHHPREDVAFAKLVERDPSLARAVDRLLQEHRVIETAGAELLEYLEDILRDVPVERKTVETAARTYIVCYRQHLDTEEGLILPRAAQVLTAADWSAVANAVPAGPDPLFGEDVAARYRSLRDQIARVT
jgi:hemerythrin-like domain-containing protein